MAYEKMTPEAFARALKEGKYSGLTGARRAIGKASWPEADKHKAAAAALKHFGEPAPKTAAAKPAVAKKTAKKGRRGALVVHGTAHDVAETSTLNGHVSPSVPESPPAKVTRSPVAPSGSVSTERATRQNSAAMVISSLGNRDMTALEQRAYTLALGELCATTSPEGQEFALAYATPAPTKASTRARRETAKEPEPEAEELEAATEEEETDNEDSGTPEPHAEAGRRAALSDFTPSSAIQD